MKLDPVFVLSPADPPAPEPEIRCSRRRLLRLAFGAAAVCGSASLGAALAERRVAAHSRLAHPSAPDLETAHHWARRLGAGPLDELVRHAPGFVAQLSLAPSDAELRDGAVRLAGALADRAPTIERRRVARALMRVFERLPRNQTETRALRQLTEVAR